MELELKPSPKIKVTFEGQSYDLARPDMRARIAFEKLLKSSAEKSDVSPNEMVVDLIASCGIPKEVLLGMEEELLNQIFDALAPKKKA